MLVDNPAMFHWRSEAGLAALRLGAADEAARLIAEERALAERFGAPRAIGVALRAEAQLLGGREGLRLHEQAIALFAGCGARVEHAHGLLELGAAIRREGRAGDARTTLHEAVRRADAAGAVALGRRARGELTAAGGRAPSRRDALSPSERRVAELAAAGRTNRQIAGELFVTMKTVEWHLANAYRKLEVRGRAELRDALAELAS
jgi:DNA-binding CsgD family transcriptional regulator